MLLRSIVLCSALALAGGARAATLDWEVPETCPDVGALEREAERALGEPLTRHALSVHGVIVPERAQLSLFLRIELPDSAQPRVRELHAARCDELLEAAAVAIALAAAESGTPASPAAPLDLGPPEPPPRPAVVPAPPPLDSGLGLGLSSVAELGALPAPGLGLELQLSWWRSWLRLGVAATWLPARDMALPSGLRASFGLAAADLLACAEQRRAQLRLGACGVAELGQLSARLERGTRGAQPAAWRGLGVRGFASYSVAGPLELAAWLSVLVPLTRPQFFAQEGESRQVHEPARLEGRLQLGLLFSP